MFLKSTLKADDTKFNLIHERGLYAKEYRVKKIYPSLIMQFCLENHRGLQVTSIENASTRDCRTGRYFR